MPRPTGSLPSTRSIASVLAALFVLAGCTDVDSGDLRSTGFYAHMEVESTDGRQAEVKVCLRTGPGLFAGDIILSGSDALTVQAGGTTKTLNRSWMRDACYVAGFDLAGGETEFVISLDREGEEEDMHDSRVVLPEDFSILEPERGTTFGLEERIEVAWAPGRKAEEIEIRYDGRCVSEADSLEISIDRSYRADDDGSHAVRVEDLIEVPAEHADARARLSCTCTVALARERAGVLDPNYGKGGVVTAAQRRSVEIRVEP